MAIKKAPSNLEILVQSGILQISINPEEAADQLLDELNCVECIAAEQCADCYGEVTKDTDRPRCREIVLAYLKQDYIKKSVEV